MKGHIRQRSPGHWAIVLDVRDPATGKRLKQVDDQAKKDDPQ
jgi:hypothetical protein